MPRHRTIIEPKGMVGESLGLYGRVQMRYDFLIQKIARFSGVPAEQVRAVMFCLPDALLSLEEDDSVRTPLGVFRTHRTKSRVVVPPMGRPEDGVVVPSSLVIRLKGGVRLRKG